MTELIARPWLWAADMKVRGYRLGLLGAFSRAAEELEPEGETDENAGMTVNVFMSRSINAGLGALVEGRDEEAAFKAIFDYCAGIKEHNKPLPEETIVLVEALRDHCTASFAHAFEVARAQEGPKIGMIDLATVRNFTGVLQ